MRRLVIALSLFAVGMQTVAAAESWRAVANADTFALGPVGYAGITSRSERAFRALCTSSNFPAQLSALVHEEKLPGLMYALVASFYFDGPTYAVLRARLVGHNLKVRVEGGCLIMAQPVDDIIAAIEKGDYESFVRFARPFKLADANAEPRWLRDTAIFAGP
jgi:hypothetical protein